MTAASDSKVGPVAAACPPAVPDRAWSTRWSSTAPSPGPRLAAEHRDEPADERVELVTCPFCRAEPGMRCSEGGRPVHAHASRVALAAGHVRPSRHDPPKPRRDLPAGQR